MPFVLFDQGKKLGEIEGWTITPYVPVQKNVLGKMVMSVPQPDECTFISPKPVNRRSELTVVENGKQQYILQVKSVKGTTVIASIISKTK